MRVLQFHKIGIHFDTIERFHIHRQAAITTLMMITTSVLTESSIPYSETSKMNLNKTPHPHTTPTQPLSHTPRPNKTPNLAFPRFEATACTLYPTLDHNRQKTRQDSAY